MYLYFQNNIKFNYIFYNYNFIITIEDKYYFFIYFKY